MSTRLIIQPYRGERGSPDTSDAPSSVVDASLQDAIRAVAGDVGVQIVALPPEEAGMYGEWRRVALANRHLGDSVAATLSEDAQPIGLLANCNSLAGMLNGLQQAVDRVGLVWIDAHADFNTPETTLSGMLGGMPVALAAGLCLHHLRDMSGMDGPIECGRIVMAGLRDVDPLEQELLDEHGVQQVNDAFADDGLALLTAAQTLAASCDAIYVHVDMDVLDPAEVAGHPLTVEGGPSSEQLAAIIERMFTIPRVRALGIASIPPPELDPVATARRAAHRLILAAVRGRCASAVRSA